MAYLPGFGPNDRDTLVGFEPDPNVVILAIGVVALCALMCKH